MDVFVIASALTHIKTRISAQLQRCILEQLLHVRHNIDINIMEQHLMKQLFTVLLSSALLSACGADSSSSKDASNIIDPPASDNLLNETHRVCNFIKNEDNDDVLVANNAIDEAEAWVLIQSMSEAGSNIDLNSVAEKDRFISAFAMAAFTAPTLADAFSVFNSAYACTDATYALNQCNWETNSEEAGLKVETVFGSNQSYTATVSTRKGATSSLQRSLVLQGTIGDLGNITFDLYEEGVNAGSRVATRSDEGTETVRWTSATTNWVATETSSCTGSLEYEDIKDATTVTLDANWTAINNSTTGTLNYQTVSPNNTAAVSINW